MYEQMNILYFARCAHNTLSWLFYLFVIVYQRNFRIC